MPRVAKPIPALTLEDYERVAQSIARVSDNAKKMRSSGLSERAIVTLIHDETGLARQDIKSVLKAAENLASWCLSK